MRPKLSLISDDYGRVWVIAPAGCETELMWALRSELMGK